MTRDDVREEIHGLCCTLLGVIYITLGSLILIGGLERLTSESYIALLKLSQGEAWPHGVAWLVAGVIMTMFNGTMRLVGVGFAVLLSNVWMGLFVKSGIDNSLAALTPIAAYGGYALLTSVLGAMMVWQWLRRKNEVK